jgi:hypothetical protein
VLSSWKALSAAQDATLVPGTPGRDDSSDTGDLSLVAMVASTAFINVDWKLGITAPLQPIVQYYGSLKT